MANPQPARASPPGVNDPRRRRTLGPQLPLQVRKEIAIFARKLKQDHRALFASDPRYKQRAGQFLASLLPPKPRRRGRPGRADVTEAIRLLKLYRRQYPNDRPAQHWARLYPAVIPGYSDMNPVQRRDAEQRLRERVRWRRRTRTRMAARENPPVNLRL